MFVSNNRPSFHLWWKENLVNHWKVSKYYETGCRCPRRLYNEHADINHDESKIQHIQEIQANTGKRKSGGSIVPRLIDNKRKHLERNLSAAQRDQLFMKKMKNDAEFRKNFLWIVGESTDCFLNSVKELSRSMSDLSKGMYASVELVFQTIASQPQLQFPQAPFHPNIIYQNLSRYSPAARIPRTDVWRNQQQSKIKTQKYKWKQFVLVETFRYIL